MRTVTDERLPLSPPSSPQYGADLDARTSKDWTPLSYAKAKGKYGLTFEKGIYPEDVLKASNPAQRTAIRLIPAPQYYGASKYGSAPPSLGNRSPRESYNPEKETFMRDRGSYQEEMEHP